MTFSAQEKEKLQKYIQGKFGNSGHRQTILSKSF